MFWIEVDGRATMSINLSLTSAPSMAASLWRESEFPIFLQDDTIYKNIEGMANNIKITPLRVKVLIAHEIQHICKAIK
ncbi:hypothetical protein [Burkholderia ubonensis]|uniref:hypothetical protein n=1 Tax=Burkholderia ubonensis TaxID=101571 RepID=UPI0012F81123|nr:hypothetical protein [Burkholderia ubonensis]